MSSADPTWTKTAQNHIAKSDSVAPPGLKDRRLKSGPVNGGTHTSGFDEILPTNTQNKLVSVMNQISTISAGKSAEFGGDHKSYTPARAKQMFFSNEGFRGDTAGTLLALPGGRTTFHTHAGGSTVGQNVGHDLRRQAYAQALPQPFTAAGDAVFGGAVMLLSRPPAEVARAGVDTTKLRDQSALSAWESNRESSKAIVNSLHVTLQKPEQQAIRHALQPMLDDLNSGAPSHFRRELAPGVPTSPRRSTAQPLSSMSTEAHGGAYLTPKAAVPPAAPVANESPAAFSRRASQFFRSPRD